MQNKKNNNFILIITTIDDLESAKKLSRSLVYNKLAGCINIIPEITSIYRWNDRIEEDEEFVLFIKTKESNYKEIENFIKNNHPYEVPEIISINIDGENEYLTWLNNITGFQEE